MGKYLNPGSGRFREAVSSEIYVDKTGLIAFTNSRLHTEHHECRIEEETCLPV